MILIYIRLTFKLPICFASSFFRFDMYFFLTLVLIQKLIKNDVGCVTVIFFIFNS